STRARIRGPRGFGGSRVRPRATRDRAREGRGKRGRPRVRRGSAACKSPVGATYRPCLDQKSLNATRGQVPEQRVAHQYCSRLRWGVFPRHGGFSTSDRLGTHIASGFAGRCERSRWHDYGTSEDGGSPMKRFTILGTLVVLLAAMPVASQGTTDQASQSAAPAASLVASLEQHKLEAIVARDPEEPGRYVAA